MRAIAQAWGGSAEPVNRSALAFRPLALEHRVQPAAALQLGEIVGAADVSAVDEDLGNGGAAVGALEHLLALAADRIHFIFLIIHPFLLEQPLGAGAIGAAELGVDLDSGHVWAPGKWRQLENTKPGDRFTRRL